MERVSNPFYEPYRVLERVYRGGAHLKIALAEEKILPESRARTVKIAYGVLEHDGYLGLCIAAFAKKQPKPALCVLLKIALYALLYLQKPRYMVANEAVELLKLLGKGGAAGFVNAFLRAFDGEKVRLPSGDEGLAAESNFPLFAVKELRAQYGERVRDIVLAKSEGVAVRFARNMENYLSAEHIDTPFENVKIFSRFARDGGYDRGDYTFQSVGSVAVCDIVEGCERLLDACAAPGGKAVLLSRKCGEVTACELRPHRVSLIESYVRRMGTENVAVLQKDGTIFDPAWAAAFDGVLCDVPCSGLGTVAENPDLPLGKREEDVKELTKTQFAILGNCAAYVKAGGFLYYATCSLLPEENDGVVKRFLGEGKEFVPVVADSPLPHEKTAYGVQFLPDKAYGAGFYVCKMRRLA